MPSSRSLAVGCAVLFAAGSWPPSGLSASGTGTGLGASHLVLSPSQPQIIYLASTLYGPYRSTDGGANWRTSLRGVGASDFYALAVHPADAKVVLIGAAGGGIYRSEDGGDTWQEASDGLSDTSVYEIVYDADHPDIVYALTLREVFRSTDGGRRWRPQFRRNAEVNDPMFHRRLLVVPGKEPMFFVATGDHGYRRGAAGERWLPWSEGREEVKVTAFAAHPGTKAIFAGGVFSETLYRSVDRGATWQPFGAGLGQVSVHRIAVDPVDPASIYLATKNKGLLKSDDAGRTWRPINNGMNEQDVKALAVHPVHPHTVYAATYNRGIFVSEDGGAHWAHRPVPPYPSWTDLYASLTRKGQAREGAPPPPPAFAKCQGCHGWTDPQLNGPTKQTFWRTFPSHREWRGSVSRMREAAQLTPADETAILDYLNTYYGVQPPPAFRQDRSQVLPVFGGKTCYPTNVVAADFDLDGRMDLAVSGFCNRVAILLADPTRPGRFQPPREIVVPTSAIGMAVVPNAGRRPLLVVSNCANPDAIDRQPLLHVISMDRFEVIQTIPSGGKAPDDIAVADFNGDARPDLAVGHWKGGVLSLLLGEPHEGRFRVPEDPSPQRAVIGDEHWQVVARDLDRDGHVDLAFPVWSFDGAAADAKTARLVVLLGNGRGAIHPTPAVSIPVDREARSLAAADFNADGALDIAVANPGSGLRSDGGVIIAGPGPAGVFGLLDAGEIGTGVMAPQGIASADFDGDGSPDLALASRPVSAAGHLSVWYNDGAGRFLRTRSQELALGPKGRVSPLSFQPLIAADVDGDGRPDLVVANNEENTVSIFFNQAPP